ncbi:MAG: hypothetical protein HW412_1189 [Bacteroidetes bacterium]|nr:hypothetical protein [Bacteroidota bacterium]
MPIQTAYAKLDIPFALLSAVVFGDDHETITINLRNGDRIQGTTNLKELRIESSVGKVSVARKDMVSISTLPDATEIVDGLVAHYPFDGNANDVTSHGNNGKLRGVVPTGDRFDIPNSAYLFDGNDCYIDLGTDSILNPTASMTITAWIKVVGSGNRDIISRWETQEYEIDERTYALGVRSDNNIYWIISPDGSHENSAVIAGSDPLPASSWNFVVATWNGSRMSLFKNGVPLASTEMPKIQKSVHVRTSIGATIGRQGDPTLNCFQGAIDDVRIYSRSLTEQEIQTLYKAK